MKELSKQFWKETSKLIDAHRKNDDERAAQGVVDSRIVFNRLVKKLTLTDVVKSFTAEQVGDMLANKFTTIEEAIHYFDNLK